MSGRVADAEQSKRPSSLKVLLVEDEMMIALLVESMLIDLGHEVMGPVGWLNKAVAMAEHEDLNLAVIDVNINGGSAYPVAAALAARGIPFIFATGYGRAGLAVPFENSPALQKPYRSEDLRAAIEAVYAVDPASSAQN